MDRADQTVEEKYNFMADNGDGEKEEDEEKEEEEKEKEEKEKEEKVVVEYSIIQQQQKETAVQALMQNPQVFEAITQVIEG